MRENPSVLSPIACVSTVTLPPPLEYSSWYRTFAGWIAGAELGDFTVCFFFFKSYLQNASHWSTLLCSSQGASKRNGQAQGKEAPWPPYSSWASRASPAIQLKSRPSKAVVNGLQAKGSAGRWRKLEGSVKSSGSSAGCWRADYVTVSSSTSFHRDTYVYWKLHEKATRSSDQPAVKP